LTYFYIVDQIGARGHAQGDPKADVLKEMDSLSTAACALDTFVNNRCGHCESGML